ncbi:MAG: hypothetical protein IJW30_00800 [Clostridia bacterium]|nr:hypothetical protein [Clostridia bacterium]
MRRRRFYVPVLCLLLLCTSLTLPVAADTESASGETLPPTYQDFIGELPEDLTDRLPDGIFSDNSEEVGSAATQMSDFSYLLQTVLSLVGVRLGSCARLLASIAGLLILSAVCKLLQSSFKGEKIARAFSLCTTLIILLALLTQGYESIRSVTDYFSTLRGVTAASIPLMGSLYAMGGNVSAAAASSTGLSLFLAVFEEIVGRSIVPFCAVCLAFALVSALDPSIRLQTLSGTIKKNYTTVLAFLMMLLLAMLGAQTTLGAKSDTLAMKSVKFAAGNMIPVVGGSVSELLRTLGASIGYLRGAVGICGILLLILLLLPTLIELFLVRLTWQLGASLADILGCDTEKKLLEEFASINGYLITAVIICSVVPILSFTLFLRCASALG